MPRLSIIIPACNAADTLGETIERLSTQSFSQWEALIVDNGSTDGTAAVAARLAAADPRLRVLHRDQRGVSAARNAGIAAAQADWLLFLDADDWLADGALARMFAEIDADPSVEFVHAAWVRSYPDGHLGQVEGRLPEVPLFEVFSRMNPCAIHACLVRKAVVEAVGGFDPSLTACEDWDLWHRIARTGVRARAIPDVLAIYRQRPNSATRDYVGFLRCGIEVIQRNHRPDPRVAHPVPGAAAGAASDTAVNDIYSLGAWMAAWRMAHGGDGLSLLSPLADMVAPGIDPREVGMCLYDGLRQGRGERTVDWAAEWPALWRDLEPVLDLLERFSHVPGLVTRARRKLERCMAADLPTDRPVTLGTLHRLPLPADGEIADITMPRDVDRFLGCVQRDGTCITTFELPVLRKASGPLLTRVVAEEVAALSPRPSVADPERQRLPVLMYHRVADRTVAGLEPYCVSPDQFDRQLALLRQHGFRSITLAEWQGHRQSGQPLPGRPVLLTFDDGYLDIRSTAWPILRRHGMTATVFLVSDMVGQLAAWDAGYGTPAPLMSWRDVHALQGEGISFGAHGATHRPLTSLTTADLLWEGNRSRAVLERELGHPVTAMAYPYGAEDEVVRRAMLDCGFEAAFTIESGFVTLGDRAMSLRRLDIRGTDDLDVFAATVGLATASAAA